MKISRYLFMLATGTAAFAVGLGWVSIAKYLLDDAPSADADMCFYEPSAQPVALDTTSFTVSDVETVQAREDDKRKFDPEGYYALSGAVPDEFSGFAYFYIENNDFNEDKSEQSQLSAPSGSVLILDDQGEPETFLNMNFISIGGGKIRFETEKYGGLSYRFVGDFLEQGNFQDLEEKLDNEGKYIPNQVLLGTLTEQKGSTSKSIKTTFQWFISAGCGQ